MMNTSPAMTIRPAVETDLNDLCALLNQIIKAGGTTAMEAPLSVADFRDYFLEGEHHVCCTVAVDSANRILGFQGLVRYPELPDDWADIGTFTQRTPRVPGVGSKLFPETLALARQQAIVAINATIRADNLGGLAYYDKMGFQDYSRHKDVPLRSGLCVDRISKRFDVS